MSLTGKLAHDLGRAGGVLFVFCIWKRHSAWLYGALSPKNRPPGENALGSFRVVDPRNLMECSRPVHSALSDQEMEVGVKIDPVPEGLDGG
jgi:hypothetical protein